LEALLLHYKAEFDVSESLCLTRWNTHYGLLLAILKREGDIADIDTKRKLKNAEETLRPFAEATDALQGNNDTLWQLVVQFGKLFHAFVKHAGREIQGTDAAAFRRIVCARASQLFSPALVLIAYLCPGTSRTKLVDQGLLETLREMHSALVGASEANVPDGYGRRSGRTKKIRLLCSECIYLCSHFYGYKNIFRTSQEQPNVRFGKQYKITLVFLLENL
jgi:hypothetical protein